jgi:hypothetical protein
MLFFAGNIYPNAIKSTEICPKTRKSRGETPRKKALEINRNSDDSQGFSPVSG